MITLQNDNTICRIDPHGGEMRALTVSGKDLLWSGDPDVFAGVAPVLFPFCGRLKDGSYRHGGAAFELPIHGFAGQSDFKVTERRDTAVTLTLCDSTQTRAIYPFSFVFEITYTLLERGVEIVFSVQNKSPGPLPFSLGGHYAFAAPNGVTGTRIHFDRPTDLIHTCLSPNGLLTAETKTVAQNVDVFAPDYTLCENDSYVFLHQVSRACSFEGIEIGYPDSPNLVLWTLPDAKFLCIEPWNGRPDSEDGVSDELIKKPDVIVLKAGARKRIRHTIEYKGV